MTEGGAHGQIKYTNYLSVVANESKYQMKAVFTYFNIFSGNELIAFSF